MNILVVGAGGREHALAWKLASSPRAERIYVAPGNAGTAAEAENIDIAGDDFPRLIRFAQQNKVGLTVVGPEAPLAAGIVDAFQKANLTVFGPTKAAAELESSKVFCKDLLRSADVPTADYHVFRDAYSAQRFITDRYPHPSEDVPWVVKADGLAAGKGVVVCHERDEALAAIEMIAGRKEFGRAGDRLILEERLDGQEVSLMAITDGRTILPLESAQDHKAAYDDDQGPNTGGMGAYSPAPIFTPKMLAQVESEILVPTIHALKRARRPFAGVLYAGLIITNQGPKVLEFNVRFGDPECQPLLMRLQTDLVDLLEAAALGQLDRIGPLQWDPRPAVCVVMASEGYPGNYESGLPIRGLTEAATVPDVQVFHAGTRLRDGQVVTAGGRVLGVTALGTSIASAKLQAYKAVKHIRWDGAWCRKDIADKALNQA
ncbi:MAG: phosphoribosylamine--glycine ligase [Pirellulales bacterium]